MKWKLSMDQKIRTGAALVVVFLLVLATNLMDSNHFKVVQKSLTSVYEDRLLAKDYIYKISRQLDIKRRVGQSLESKEILDTNSIANDSISTLISFYKKTALTERESVRFESLKKNIDQLLKYEKNHVNTLSLDQESFQQSEDFLTAIYSDLDALSKIQIEEGKREMDVSNRTIKTSNLISRIEIGILIVIGLLIQLLIFMKPFK